jgi:tetratricopeptide (TPR) repeat protein
MLATTFVTLGMYLKLLVVPYPLCYDYSFNQIPITTWTDWRAIGSLLIYTTLGIYCLLTLKKKNIFAFCIAFFFITFSVSSNLIVKIGATFGERFLYTPMLAFCIAIVVVVYRLFNKIPGPSPYIARGAYVVFFLLVFTYSFLTIRRNPDWNNNLSLFLSGVKVSPNSAKTQFALGLAFYEKGMNEKDPVTCTNSLKKSIDHYKKSVTIYPLYSHAWYNLGLSYYQAGKKDSAMAAFKSALAVRPDYKEALMNLSNIYSERGEWKNALDTFLKLLGFDPDDAKVLGNIGVAYQNLNQFSSAISYYEKAIAIDPNSLFVYKNLIVLYKFLGDPSKASYYEKIADKLK